MITVKYRGQACHFDTEGVDLDAPGGIYGRLMRGEFYEQPLLSHIASLKVRGTYVDVGACVGTHSVFFALCCPSDRVFAFEPRSSHRALFERTLELNDLHDKVTVSPLALSDAKGQVTVELDGRTQKLNTERLDSLVQGPVALMKIDVEGMEPRVLAGATELLRKHRPRIFAEAHTDESVERVLEHLRPFGYVATGRVFNASPTYEFVVPPSPLMRLLLVCRRTALRLLKLVLPVRVRKTIRGILRRA
jgi:FkbM family methyltransferase